MSEMIKQVAVLGGGSFGTAIANMIAVKGHQVNLWMRDGQLADSINLDRKNDKYLPDLELDQGVTATTALENAVASVDFVFVAVPSQSCREVANRLAGSLPTSAYVISLTKGIEQGTFTLMSRILQEALPDNAVGVMSGPNLAREIADKQITATVIASGSPGLVESVQAILHSDYFRVYAGSDIFGVELGGALKNCYAIMCGMANALGCGQNTIGFLITRSLSEMCRLASRLGADPMTFMGLSGVGDLVVTCTSPLSRNYQVGYELGQGHKLDDVCDRLGQVAEGVNTLQQVREKAEELGVYMPLVQGMCRIFFEHEPIETVVSSLMMADQTQDVEFEANSS